MTLVPDGRGVVVGTKSLKLAVHLSHPAEMHNRSFSLTPDMQFTALLKEEYNEKLFKFVQNVHR